MKNTQKTRFSLGKSMMQNAKVPLMRDASLHITCASARLNANKRTAKKRKQFQHIACI